MKLFNTKDFLLLDGIFFALIGFVQTINSFIGYKYGVGGYKILNEDTFASLGFFEMNFMIGLLGIVLIRGFRTDNTSIFWFVISSITHSFIALSNIIFWEDTFLVNNAQLTGKIATIIHLSLALIALYNIKLLTTKPKLH